MLVFVCHFKFRSSKSGVLKRCGDVEIVDYLYLKNCG